MSGLIPHIEVPLIPADSISMLALTIFFMPIITFILLFFTGKHILASIRSWLATGVMGVMFVLSVYLHISIKGEHLSRWIWFEIGTIKFTTSMLLNNYSTTMMVIATFVSFMVHLYSVQYMKERRNHSKYFPYLALFVSSMLGIILSDNLLITFIFWELVGLASFLLIGFWYEKDTSAAAAKKAFLYNKFADLAFVIAIMILYAMYGTTEISILKELVNLSVTYQAVLAVPIFAGLAIWFATVGKSAQFPLYVWLPDAMAGPTPVSALLHAATMVAAGVFLLLKTSFLLIDWVPNLITIFGCVTALLAALQAIRTFDSKKVLAFSTVSQLGYMMMAVGVGADDAAFFHLATHAFFKACLFLSVGAVIHAMHHMQSHQFDHGQYKELDALDMRLMGGFRKKMPITFAAYSVSYAALIGLPFFSGFLSKDAILGALYDRAVVSGSWSWLIVAVAFTTVGLTAFYMTRQMILIFFGEFRLLKTDASYKKYFDHIVESEWLINIPLILLGAMSFWFFFSLNPLHAQTGWWMKDAFVSGTHHEFHIFIPIVASLFTLGAIAIAVQKYKTIDAFVDTRLTLTRVFANNYFIEKGITFLFVQPVFMISNMCMATDDFINRAIHAKAYFFIVVAQLADVFDRWVIDGLVHFVAGFIRYIGSFFRSYLKGNIQGYFYFTLIAFALMLLWLGWYL
ncbi:NADH-quinone oxidoreductase subunit L [Cytophaga aurantiaca]|uniref:NADH-quinone oxidoreductase subunit 5 family protein n=1 Tax=Cytophaga aurantiaca TaxID=29530 RepID=UPI0004778F23|nr:NADH-quinone oxidoreductase subunit L [Cytophaga aurantiaca]